jgi:hypothetical protein
MAQNVSTGQLDLSGIKQFILGPAGAAGSATNTSGFYPFTGNPSGFATTAGVVGVSGDLSGYIDTVSGDISTRIGSSGIALSGHAISLNNAITTDLALLSGDVVELSGQYVSTQSLATGSKANINTLSGNLITTGQTLTLSITGQSGVGLSGYITGFVRAVSGVLSTKVSNTDIDLRGHVLSDFLSKKDSEQTVSGDIHFKKNPQFNLGIELDNVSSHSNITTVQTGTLFYNLVSSQTISGASFETMTSYLRMPHSGDSANQNLVVGSFMYSGGIP